MFFTNTHTTRMKGLFYAETNNYLACQMILYQNWPKYSYFHAVTMLSSRHTYLLPLILLLNLPSLPDSHSTFIPFCRIFLRKPVSSLKKALRRVNRELFWKCLTHK